MNPVYNVMKQFDTYTAHLLHHADIARRAYHENNRKQKVEKYRMDKQHHVSIAPVWALQNPSSHLMLPLLLPGTTIITTTTSSDISTTQSPTTIFIFCTGQFFPGYSR